MHLFFSEKLNAISGQGNNMFGGILGKSIDLVNDTVETVVEASVGIASTTVCMGLGLVEGKLPSKSMWTWV